MSENYDSENNPEITTSIDDDDDDNVIVGDSSESTINQEVSSREANYDSNNSNDDGVIVNADHNGSGGDSDGVVVSDDAGREDMFLDAPEDLGADGRDSTGEPQESTDWDEDRVHESQTRFSRLDNEMQNDYMVDEMERLRAMLDKTVNEKESIAREHKDEMEMAAKGIANLRNQMRDMINKQLLIDDNQFRSHEDAVQTPLHELIHECSMFLRSVVEEFQDLNTKSTEASVSREVFNAYLNSAQNQSAEIQFQKDQYMEDTTNRMLSSLASVVYVGDLLDNTLIGRIAHIEKSVFSLIENYNWFLFQGDQLRQCLVQVRPDLGEQTDYGVIFAAANQELLGFPKKETDFVEKMSHFESENSKLMEQIETHKAMYDAATAELEKLKAELDHEKHRYFNTKEKLSLAVTKGKALVQQRDSLKQTVADKTSELDRCLVELKEKSSALEAAELIKEELVRSQISGASLQELLAEKDLILEKLDDIMLQISIPELSKSKDVTERIRWIVDERTALKDDSLKFHQLADILLSIKLPENVSFSDLESRLVWITKSYDEAKAEMGKLQDEIKRTRESLSEATSEIGILQGDNSCIRETAVREMDHLIALLSTVLVEREYVTVELEDMSNKFETTVLSERQAISEKEDILKILQKASGVAVVDGQLPEIDVLVECLANMKEGNNSTHDSLEVKDENFRIMQILLYVKDLDSALHEILFKEETLIMKMEINNLLTDLTRASEEKASLKEQNEKLQKDLDRIEEKSALIREKLSMAVKKGKGLVQEREGLKQLIDEKSSEIEKLKVELEQRELAIINYENETSKLSQQVLSIAKLEEDGLALEDQRNQLERDFSVSNKLVNVLTESIHSIALPADLSFEEPVDKLKWLAGYFSECEAVKVQAQQQLDDALVEVETLTSQVSEAQSIIKSLEDALAVAEEKYSHLSAEKAELENVRTSFHERLEKAMQEVHLLAEADAAKSSLDNALAVAESNVSRLSKEKNEAESCRSLAEVELEKARWEITDLTSKLSEATVTLKTHENTISDFETRMAVLHDDNNDAQIARTSLENELKKLKEEADTQESKLQEAHTSIKSLEDALSKAENVISELDSEKKAAEQEISTLSAKLSTCLEDLAGTHGSLESRSLKLLDHLKGLELIGEDTSLFSSLRKCHESKLECLNEIEDVCNIIRGQCAKLSPENNLLSQEPSCITRLLSTSVDDIVDLDTYRSHGDAVEGDDISLYAQKIVEEFHVRKRTLVEKVDRLSSFLCECDASVVQELKTVSKWMMSAVEELQSLDQKVKNIETEYQVLKEKVIPLEDEISILLSACTEATQVLQFEVEKRIEFGSSPQYENQIEPKSSESKHKIATELLSTTRKVCSVCEQLENARNGLSSVIEELQNKLNELKIVLDNTTEERDLYLKKVSDLVELENNCSELRLKLENYQDIEDMVREKDREILSLQSSLTMKEKELQHQIELLSHEKEELQIALTEQHRETELLKERIRASIDHEEELVMVKSKISSLESGLDRIIQKFASRDVAGDQKSATTDDLLQVLEKQVVTTISESRNLKSKIHELESEVKKSVSTEEELANIKGQLLDLEEGVLRVIKNLGGDMDLKPLGTSDLLLVLEKMAMSLTLECEKLKGKDHELGSEIWNNSDELELAKVKGQLVDLEAGMWRIFLRLRGDTARDQGPTETRDLLQLLERLVMAVITESENSKSEVHELNFKLHESQKAVNELLLKVRVLEESIQSRVAPDIIQERSIFEAPSQPSASEISEVGDVGPVSKPTISPVPSSTHVRSTWKGPSDHIALNIDSESSRLIDNEEAVEDKGHVFKSLNTSGLVPVQGKLIADRIDGIWVSGGRLLMRQPRARLGLIAYWLVLHIWLLGTIL
ncbi:trans-Golgi network-localized SYP41-interacting protein 1 isoform X2 [Amaranthus tricolor]|uniref:trans-Golgi network-localized SYP41-interacting protein 1 isoform X2 n=1 Tax=Amaranthus tricolor TaxID=29722 RepID=UPI00258AFA6A|nr:trans-Golgi network-localized SYP41-interacting protein 1 isoform X2 [Amaranthus tricolor]